MTDRQNARGGDATTETMSCAECLRLVTTADVASLADSGDGRAMTVVAQHCRGCADCASVVDAVTEDARRLADTLDGASPGVPSHVVALHAVAGSARARQRTSGVGIAALVTVLVIAAGGAMALVRPSSSVPVETRTVELRCLSPEQAGELARSQLPPGIQVTMRPALDLPVLTLRGTPRDLAAAEQIIARLDDRWAAERSAYCGAARPPAPR